MPDLPPVSRLLRATELVRIGRFAVGPDDPRFAGAGQMHRHEFVFPRTSVWIERPGQRPFLSDPTCVNYYNRHEPYSRRPASAEGDRCDWFAVESGPLLELVASLDPAAGERPERPFRFTHGPSDAASYRRQRLAVRLAAQPQADALRLEELVLEVLTHVLRLAHAQQPRHADGATASPRQRELAERVQAVLADRYAEPLALADLARMVASSPFHLCRAFKRATGMTVARYRHELRLRASLERVAEPGADLTTVALDLGFASHSHFTCAFRDAYGEPPSTFRAAASSQRVAAARRRLAVAHGSA